MVKIESGIPVPKRGMRRGKPRGTFRGLSEVIKSCQVGDSFVWPVSSAQGIGSAANYQGIRIVTRNCEGGVRVWRVS